MRTKVTLILLLLNVGLFFYIFKYSRNIDRVTDSNVLLGPETSNIQSLEISTANGDTPIKLERNSENAWSLIQPLQWPANEFAVTRILSELQQLRPYTSFAVSDLAHNGMSLADYGLEKPPLTLTFTPAAALASAPTP